MLDIGLKHRVVMITGANHGIGAATARAFAAQGARVFITYYRDATRYSPEGLERAQQVGVGGDVLYRAMQQQSADPLVEQICSAGGTAVAHEIDLSIPEM
jgi:3-oxoacyl-[acyl-carrier protein] reductase